MNTIRAILVTGSPRAGTSWVGRIIGQEPFTHYIHEPFNISNRPCLCGAKFKHWFWYLSLETYHEYKEHLDHTIFPAYTWVGLCNAAAEIARSRRIRPLARHLKSLFARRVIVKDPIAVFSAETLAHLYGMDVVVLVRHPAAIASSYKGLNWRHQFSHFIKQRQLMEEHLAPFRHEIEDFAKHEYEIVDQAALLWKLIHHRIIHYQETQPNWAILRYEDLALEPVAAFRKIFDYLRLPFSKNSHARIESHRLQTQPPEIMDPYTIKQNPQAAASKWSKNLTVTEIARIRKRVEDVSQFFYADDAWSGIPAALPFVGRDFVSALAQRIFVETHYPENQITAWADQLVGLTSNNFAVWLC